MVYVHLFSLSPRGFELHAVTLALRETFSLDTLRNSSCCQTWALLPVLPPMSFPEHASIQGHVSFINLTL